MHSSWDSSGLSTDSGQRSAQSPLHSLQMTQHSSSEPVPRQPGQSRDRLPAVTKPNNHRLRPVRHVSPEQGQWHRSKAGVQGGFRSAKEDRPRRPVQCAALSKVHRRQKGDRVKQGMGERASSGTGTSKFGVRKGPGECGLDPREPSTGRAGLPGQ